MRLCRSPMPIKPEMEITGKPSSGGGQGAPLGWTKPLMPMEAAVKLVLARVLNCFTCSRSVPRRSSLTRLARRCERTASPRCKWERCRYR